MAAKLFYPNGLNVVLFASGRGSNAEALMKLSEELDGLQVQAVASDKADAPVLEKAKKRGFKTLVHERRPGQSKVAYETQWIDILTQVPHDLGLLCGYMKILGPHFLNFYWDPELSIFRLINIHPSLLPAYPGLNSYQRAFENGEPQGGVTLHLVDEGVDSGPILMQQSFERLEEETFESFERRGLALEHELYPKLIRTLISEGVEIKK